MTSERKTYLTPFLTLRASCNKHLSPWRCRRAIPSVGATYNIHRKKEKMQGNWNRGKRKSQEDDYGASLQVHIWLKETSKLDGAKELDVKVGIHLSDNTIPRTIENSFPSNQSVRRRIFGIVRIIFCFVFGTST